MVLRGRPQGCFGGGANGVDGWKVERVRAGMYVDREIERQNGERQPPLFLLLTWMHEDEL